MPLYKLATASIGPTAGWFLASYLIAPGALAAGPLILASLVVLIFCFFPQFRIDINRLNKSQMRWIGLLLLFGIWSLFTGYIHEATPAQLETPTKFIIGAFVGFSICAIGVNYRWVQGGVIAAGLGLGILVLSEYDGNGRFSPLMNATKWGNALSFLAILAIGLTILGKTWIERTVFLSISIFSVYAVTISGTRGAILPLILAIIAVSYIYRSGLGLKTSIGLITTLGLAVVALSQLEIVKSRAASTYGEIVAIQQDNFSSSTGYRLTMWNVGINAAIDNPLLGAGHDYPEIFSTYPASTEGMRAASQSIGNNFENFHSMYVDTAVRSGFVGLFLLLSLLAAGLAPENRASRILMLSPIIGIVGAGLTDSALALGITTDYLILAGNILMATKR